MIILPLRGTSTYTQLTEARRDQDGDARVLNLRQHALANARSVTPVGACLIERCLGGVGRCEMPVTQEAAFEMKTIVVIFKVPNGDAKLILFEGLADGIIIEGGRTSPRFHGIDGNVLCFCPELHSLERFIDPAASQASSFVPELHSSVHVK